MKFYLPMAGAALAMLFSSEACFAEGVTYDCDTAAGHFSELVLPATGSSFTVSGTVRLNALAASKDYVPLARITIASAVEPGHESDTFAGFSISALPVDARKSPTGAPAIQMLNYDANGQKSEALPFSLLEKPGTPEPFTLTYNGSTVSVRLGQASKEFALKAASPVVRIVCSTGEFLITDLAIKS